MCNGNGHFLNSVVDHRELNMGRPINIPQRFNGIHVIEAKESCFLFSVFL